MSVRPWASWAGEVSEGLPAVAGPDLAGLEGLVAEARVLAAGAEAASTRRNYATDVAAFTRWCAARNLAALPAGPEVVALYLTDYAHDHRASSVVRRAVGIAKAHRRAGYPSPTDHEAVRLVLAGIRRAKGMAPDQKTPLVTDDIVALVATCDPTTLAGIRDRAVLLAGYMGAFRRSELAALNTADLEDRPQGLAVTVRRSKVDQEGHGRRKVLV